MTNQIDYISICKHDDSLREYQQTAKSQIFAAWNTCNDVMLQMPTGTGKTVLFSSIISDLYGWMRMKGDKRKILIIVHRTELVTQSRGKLLRYNVPVSFIAGKLERRYTVQVQIASIQTLSHPANRKLAENLNVGFIIIDEAHHSVAASYKKLWELYPTAKKLGVTATPWRMNHSGFTDLFQKLVTSQPVKSFIQQGYLSSYRYYSIKQQSRIKQTIDNIHEFMADGEYKSSALERDMDKSEIRAQLLQSYQKYVNGKKGIIYAISRVHSQHICEEYRKAGIIIRHIDALTPAEERREVVNDFKNGRIRIIVNVDVFSEGFDCPDIEFIQLARPTQSLAKYLQQVGRGLRPHSGKDNCIILDNVGLHSRFGLPDANRHWLAHFKGGKDTDEQQKIVPGNGNNKRHVNMEEGNEQLSLILNDGIREIKNDIKSDSAKGKKQRHVHKSNDSVPFKKSKDYYENLPDGTCRIIDSFSHVLYSGSGYIDEFAGKLYRVINNKEDGFYAFVINRNFTGYKLKRDSRSSYSQQMIVAAGVDSDLAKLTLSDVFISVENIENQDEGYVITCASSIGYQTFNSMGDCISIDNSESGVYALVPNNSDDEMELVYGGDDDILEEEIDTKKDGVNPPTETNVEGKESLDDDESDTTATINSFNIESDTEFDSESFCKTYMYKPLGELICLNGQVYDVFAQNNGCMSICLLDVDNEELRKLNDSFASILSKKYEENNSQTIIANLSDKYWFGHRYEIAKAKEGTHLHDILVMREWGALKSIENQGLDHTTIIAQVVDLIGVSRLVHLNYSGIEKGTIEQGNCSRTSNIHFYANVGTSVNIKVVDNTTNSSEFVLHNGLYPELKVSMYSDLGQQFAQLISNEYRIIKIGKDIIYFHDKLYDVVRKYDLKGNAFRGVNALNKEDNKNTENTIADNQQSITPTQEDLEDNMTHIVSQVQHQEQKDIPVEQEWGTSQVESFTFSEDKKTITGCRTDVKGRVWIPQGVEIIDESAFAYCDGITELHVPESVHTIAKNAFRDCTALTYIDLGQLKVVGDKAFSGCVSLSDIKFSENIDTIPTKCFMKCTSLRNISFPSKLISIKSSAFSGCSGLRELTFGKFIKHLETGAFENCSSLERVTIDSLDIKIDTGVFNGCSALQYIVSSISPIFGRLDDNAFSGINPDCDLYTQRNYVSKYLLEKVFTPFNKILPVEDGIKKYETITNEQNDASERVCMDELSIKTESIVQNEKVSADFLNFNLVNAFLSSKKKSIVTIDRDSIDKFKNTLAHTSTSYKYLWICAILQIIHEELKNQMFFDDIAIRMLAISWQYSSFNHAKQDRIPLWKRRIIHNSFTLSYKSTDKEVISAMKNAVKSYEYKELSKIYKGLTAIVPYRFLNPWVNTSNDLTVREISQKEEYDCPYSIHSESAIKGRYIIVNDKWYKFFKSNYEELYHYCFNEYMRYLKSKNPKSDIEVSNFLPQCLKY